MVMESAGIEFVDYTSSNEAGTELSRLAGTADGYMDSVHVRRVETRGRSRRARHD